MDIQKSQDLAQETPVDDVFMAPSIDRDQIKAGTSYTYMSPIPETVKTDMSTECVLGVDEAGRGPVLGMAFSSHHSPIAFLTNNPQAPWSTACIICQSHSIAHSSLRHIISTIQRSLLLPFDHP